MDIPASAATTAAITTFGTAVTSTIDFLGDHDWFRVNLVAGQKYVFTLDGTTLSDPLLTLFNASGVQLATNDDVEPGYNPNSQITFTATTTGTHFLDASQFQNNDTGNYRITAYQTSAALTLDQVADYLAVGSWNGNGYQFSTPTITYNLQGLTAAQQNLARVALQSWDDVGGFNFVQTTGAAQITFANSGSNDAYATANGSSAQIVISSDWNGGRTGLNSYTLQTYIHEIGHALGLGHAGPYNGSATFGVDNLYANDSWAVSIQSYFAQNEAGTGSFDYVLSPQLADIIAIGNLYGLSTTTRTGDTVYGFNSNISTATVGGLIYHFDDAIYGGSAPALTLFDNGGIDTLDLSGYGANQRIDLNETAQSDVGGQTNNISIARGSIIENAVGGSGADRITGNAAANALTGGAGNDTLIGGGGGDVLFGSAGADSLVGGAGDDIYYVDSAGDVVAEALESGTDSIYSSVSYTISANAEQLLAIGSAAGLVLTGNNTANVLYGSLHIGGVSLIGNGGDDIFYGSNYADNINGGDDNDILQAFYSTDGEDTLTGGAGNDVYYIFEQGDVVVESANGGFDTIYAQADVVLSDNVEQVVLYGDGSTVTGNGGNNNLFGNNSTNSVTLSGGDGDDWLVGSNQADTLNGGTGNDIIQGLDGANQLVGGAGNDQYYSTSVSDIILEGAGEGFETLYANYNVAILSDNVEQLLVYGGVTSAGGNGSDNTIFGNNNSVGLTLDGAAGADVLYGSTFADLIIGGAGNDTLIGFGGADRFGYVAGNSGADTIVDFVRGADHIDLAGLGYNAASIGGAIQVGGGPAGLVSFTGGALSGTTITLLNVDGASITASDFLFA